MAEPVFRGGMWWQQQDDGTWLRWNDGSSSWERSDQPPPPPDAPTMPPMPPMPTGGGYGAAGGQAVPNYLVWAILVTIFCFLPTGIVAIVFASQVSSKLAAGDRAGAIEASNKAKTWTIVSAAVGVVFVLIWIAVAAGTDSYTSFSFS